MKTDYLDQVSIPEGSSGSHSIQHFKHPANKPLETSSLRTKLMAGHKNRPVVYPHETTWHRLVYDGGVWMTDLPIEQAQIRPSIKALKGHVLVGGLGIGLVVNWLAQKRTVKSVTVVELSEDVVNLVAKHIRDPRKIVTVVNRDLFKYLKEQSGSKIFDSAFYDIWQSDSETTFFETVCPLRKLSWPLVLDSKIICWNEDIMRGQLVQSLHSRHFTATHLVKEMKGAGIPLERLAHPNKEDSPWLTWSAPFFQALEKGIITGENFREMASLYANLYGTKPFPQIWERMMGQKVLA